MNSDETMKINATKFQLSDLETKTPFIQEECTDQSGSQITSKSELTFFGQKICL